MKMDDCYNEGKILRISRCERVKDILRNWIEI